MKIKDLNKRQLKEVIDLETQNIIPILSSVGIHLSKMDMVNEREFNKEAEIILFEENSRNDSSIDFEMTKDSIIKKLDSKLKR